MKLISVTSVQDNGSLCNRTIQLFLQYSQYIALGLLIALVSIINIAWIRQDTLPLPHVDAHKYLRLTLEFIDTLETQGGVQIWATVAALSHGGRPPLYQLITVPFILLFGRSIDAGLAVNILFGAVLILSTYGMGRTVKNGKAGLLATCVVVAYPPIVNLSRTFLPHFATAACVALSLWLLFLLVSRRSVRIAWLFGASLAFGLLIRHYFVLYLAVPTLILGVHMLLFQTIPRSPLGLEQAPRWLLAKLCDPFVLNGLLPAAIIAIVLGVPWYLTRGLSLLEIVQNNAARELVVTAGSQNVSPSFWWYALTSPSAISYVFTGFLVIGLLVGIIRRQLFISVLVVTFLAAYSLLSLRKGLAWFYLGGMLPVAAVLTANWIVDVPNRLLRMLIVVTCLGVAVFNFSFVTWGLEPWGQPVAFALGAPTCRPPELAGRRSAFFCPNPARDENWPVSDVLHTVLNDPECQDQLCHLMVVMERRVLFFNAETFKYRLIQDFPGTRLAIHDIDIKTQSGVVYYQLPALLNSQYLLYTDRTAQKDYVSASTQFLQSPPIAFAEAHQAVDSFTLPNRTTATLVRRIKPLTIEEAETAIAALDLPEADKWLQFTVLAPLFIERSLSENEDADIAYHPNVAVDPDSIDLWQSLAQALFDDAQYEEAGVIYQQILRIDPYRIDARLGLALTYNALSSYEEASREFTKVIEYGPAGRQASQAQHWLDKYEQQVENTNLR